MKWTRTVHTKFPREGPLGAQECRDAWLSTATLPVVRLESELVGGRDTSTQPPGGGVCVKMTFLRIFEVSNSRERFEGRVQSGNAILKNKLKAENQWQMIKEIGSRGTLARERGRVWSVD